MLEMTREEIEADFDLLIATTLDLSALTDAELHTLDQTLWSAWRHSCTAWEWDHKPGHQNDLIREVSIVGNEVSGNAVARGLPDGY